MTSGREPVIRPTSVERTIRTKRRRRLRLEETILLIGVLSASCSGDEPAEEFSIETNEQGLSTTAYPACDQRIVDPATRSASEQAEHCYGGWDLIYYERQPRRTETFVSTYTQSSWPNHCQPLYWGSPPRCTPSEICTHVEMVSAVQNRFYSLYRDPAGTIFWRSPGSVTEGSVFNVQPAPNAQLEHEFWGGWRTDCQASGYVHSVHLVHQEKEPGTTKSSISRSNFDLNRYPYLFTFNPPIEPWCDTCDDLLDPVARIDCLWDRVKVVDTDYILPEPTHVAREETDSDQTAAIVKTMKALAEENWDRLSEEQIKNLNAVYRAYPDVRLTTTDSLLNVCNGSDCSRDFCGDRFELARSMEARPRWDGVSVAMSHSSVDGGILIDGDTSTGIQTNHRDWQNLRIDLGRTGRFNGLRRHMSKGSVTNRGSQGEAVHISMDGSNWTRLTGATTSGWEAYTNYSNGGAWRGLPYGWSAWIRPKGPVRARFVMFEWDGNSDSIDEVEIDWTVPPKALCEVGHDAQRSEHFHMCASMLNAPRTPALDTALSSTDPAGYWSVADAAHAYKALPFLPGRHCAGLIGSLMSETSECLAELEASNLLDDNYADLTELHDAVMARTLRAALEPVVSLGRILPHETAKLAQAEKDVVKALNFADQAYQHRQTIDAQHLPPDSSAADDVVIANIDEVWRAWHEARFNKTSAWTLLSAAGVPAGTTSLEALLAAQLPSSITVGENAYSGREFLDLTLNEIFQTSNIVDADMVRLGLSDHAGQPALTGRPLLHLLGRALSGLDQSIINYAPIHDIACRLHGCAESNELTALSRFAGVVGGFAEEDVNVSQSRVDDFSQWANSHTAPGPWADVFPVIDRDRILTALSDLVPGSMVPLREALADRLRLQPDPMTDAFTTMVMDQESLYARYADLGFLIGGSTDNIRTGLHFEKRQEVRSAVIGDQSTQGSMRDNLSQANNRYHSDLFELLKHTLVRIDQDRKTEALKAELNSLVSRREERFTLREQFLHDIDEAGTDASELVTDLIANGGVVGGQTYFTLSQTGPITVSAAAAEWQRRTRQQQRLSANTLPFSQLTTLAPTQTRAGEVLHISVSGSYSPTCSLTGAEVLSRDGTRVPVNVPSNAQCGPEGWAVVAGSSATDAVVVDRTTRRTDTNGRRTNSCGRMGGGLSINYIVSINLGGGAEFCTYTEDTYSVSDSRSTSQSEALTNDLRITGGFRAPRGNVPFPAGTAGALYAVIVPRGAATMGLYDHQVIALRSGDNVIPIDNRLPGVDYDVYLIPNDCDGSFVSSSLTVRISRLQSSASLLESQNFAAAIAESVTAVRQTERVNGEIRRQLLASDVDTIRTQARARMVQNLQVTYDQLPSEIRDLHELLLAREIDRLAKVVRVRNLDVEIAEIDRELILTFEQLVLLSDEVTATRIGESLTLRRLQADYVTRAIGSVIFGMTDFLMPLMETWEGNILEDLRTLADRQPSAPAVGAMERLLSLRPDQTIGQIGSDFEIVLKYLYEAFGTRSLESGTPADEVVIVSIPRPGSPPTAVPTSYGRVSDATASQIWAQVDAIRAGSTDSVRIKLTPDDLYLWPDASLACNASRPVVRRAGVIFVKSPFAIPPVFRVTGPFTAVQSTGELSPLQPVLTANGEDLFMFDGNSLAQWLSFRGPVLVLGPGDDHERYIRNAWGMSSQAVSPYPLEGFSPLAEMSLDLRSAGMSEVPVAGAVPCRSVAYPRCIEDVTSPLAAYEMLLVMQVESIEYTTQGGTAERVDSSVRACRP